MPRKKQSTVRSTANNIRAKKVACKKRLAKRWNKEVEGLGLSVVQPSNLTSSNEFETPKHATSSSHTGLPGVFLVPWVVVRAQLEDTLCWTTHYNKNLFLLIRVPIVGSILLSFALFLNIVRVLLLKLRTFGHGRVAHRTFRYSRWARSTLVLVPLFGSHYALFLGMSYYMGVNQTVEIVWLFCDQLFASFQGCCVSLLYCLLNVEVRAEVTRKWRSWRLRRHHPRTGSLSSTAVGLTSIYGRQPSANNHMNNLQLSVQTMGPTMISAPCVDTCL